MESWSSLTTDLIARPLNHECFAETSRHVELGDGVFWLHTTKRHDFWPLWCLQDGNLFSSILTLSGKRCFWDWRLAPVHKESSPQTWCQCSAVLMFRIIMYGRLPAWLSMKIIAHRALLLFYFYFGTHFTELWGCLSIMLRGSLIMITKGSVDYLRYVPCSGGSRNNERGFPNARALQLNFARENMYWTMNSLPC